MMVALARFGGTTDFQNNRCKNMFMTPNAGIWVTFGSNTGVLKLEDETITGLCHIFEIIRLMGDVGIITSQCIKMGMKIKTVIKLIKIIH